MKEYGIDEKTSDALFYVKASPHRVKVLKLLEKEEQLIPTEIAKLLNIRITRISLVLRQLKEYNLVVCINEESHKFRVYELTVLGEEIANYIQDNLLLKDANFFNSLK